MEKHKTTPWKIGAMEPGMVAIDSSDNQEVTGFIDPEDSAIIVACVNACDGIPIDVLEDDCFNKMREDRDMLIKQRDDLLAALEKIAKHYEDKCGLDATPSKRAEAWRLDYHNVKGIAINAIASVKGGAA